MTALRTCLICEATSAGTLVVFHQCDICDWCERELARLGRVWCRTGRHDVALAESNKARCKACDRARNRAVHSPHSRAEEARDYREKNRALLHAYYRRHAAYKRDYSRRRYWSNPTHWRAVGRQRRFNRKLAVLREWRRT